MPINPERLPGASDYAYLNINTSRRSRRRFQQGVFEHGCPRRLLASRSRRPRLEGCGVPAPAANVLASIPRRLTLGGQSMGGMYTNLVGAIEPRFGALVPTGAGGF